MLPDQGPVVLIGLKEIYDALLRLDATVATLVNQHNEVRSDIADHETRLRALERARWPLPAASVLVSLVAIAITIIPKLGGP